MKYHLSLDYGLDAKYLWDGKWEYTLWGNGKLIKKEVNLSLSDYLALLENYYDTSYFGTVFIKGKLTEKKIREAIPELSL